MTSPGAPAVAEGRAARRRRGYWVPGLIALVVLLGIGLALGAGDLDHGSPGTLAGPQIAQSLGAMIQANQGNPSLAVHCPHSEPARSGVQFVCTVTGAGATRTVHVTEIDSRGGLSWRFGT